MLDMAGLSVGGLSAVIVVAAVERTDRNISEENVSDLWDSIK